MEKTIRTLSVCNRCHNLIMNMTGTKFICGVALVENKNIKQELDREWFNSIEDFQKKKLPSNCKYEFEHSIIGQEYE